MYYHHSHQLRNYTISFILNVAGDLPELQAPPQLCSIKDSDNIEADGDDDDDNNNNNNNNNNNSNNYNYTIITIA